MYLFDLVKPKARQYISLFILGVLNSLLYSSLIILLNQSLTSTATGGGLNTNLALLFVAILVGSYLSRRFYQSYLIRFTNSVLFDLELSIVRKVVSASYESFVKVKKEAIYTAINDIKTIVQFPRILIDVFNTTVMIVFSLGYMLFLQPMLASLVLGMTALIFLAYYWQNKKISSAFERIRELENHYYRYLNDLLMGYKAVKMSTERTETIYEHYLKKNRNETEGLETNTAIRYANNEVLGSFAWFAILGFVIFGLPLLGRADPQITVSFTVTILYIVGPLTTLVSTLPYFSRSATAIRRLQAFDEQVQHLDVVAPAMQVPIAEFESVTFRDLEYSYKDDFQRTTFHLGPLDLTINRGETVFIVGSNGSGKSTFLLLLTGLLDKQWGKMYLNGQSMTKGHSAAYRDLITTLFTDAHLFSEHYDRYRLNPTDPTLLRYIDLLGLTGKIRFTGQGTISGELSKGQQKRLGMVLALMEAKPIIVMDEWAAEQDPSFRYYFYDQLLPILKQEGKTVIAVTHDDRYFGFADRIVEFSAGRIIEHQQTVELDLTQ
ncbi:cyclic peptide export ABC transporter [Fibrella sp. WM1]|uniref:cyclic peptide export ABC transporter n=1 Tax=Fibrella musci TaxID=3242485 RepID=UPI00351F8EC2